LLFNVSKQISSLPKLLYCYMDCIYFLVLLPSLFLFPTFTTLYSTHQHLIFGWSKANPCICNNDGSCECVVLSKVSIVVHLNGFVSVWNGRDTTIECCWRKKGRHGLRLYCFLSNLPSIILLLLFRVTCVLHVCILVCTEVHGNEHSGVYNTSFLEF
jgi:hypothetical protein